MKRLMLALAVVLFVVIGASAATEVVDGVTWNYSVADGKASVYKGSSSPAISSETKGALTIPAMLGDCPVTSIGAYAFYGCSWLTSVTMPESVTSIGGYAFYNCSRLTAVTIPSSVTSIGSCTFYGCSGLTSVTIPEGVTSVEAFTFYNCSGLMSVTIPSSVASINNKAFFGCSGLTRVDITDLVKWCGIHFGGVDVNPLPYAHHLYLNGEEVKNLVIPAGVTSIGSSTFSGCRGLTTVTIPEGVMSIGSSAFSGCSGLTSVTIPEGVTSIGSSTFSGCSGLMAVTIPEGVTFIESSAFSGCSGLTSVTIPSSVTSIGSSAFSGCSGLTSVTIPEGVTSVEASTFYNCSGLVSATIPSSVTSIGSSAFSGCSGLASVAIPEGVTSIGSMAFYRCRGLTSVTIPSSVTSIGSMTFEYCTALKSVTIPEGVTFIESSAFSGCSGLTSVTIPSSVTSIGSSAFSGCSGLTSVTIPEGVTSIESEAFYRCGGLTTVTIPASVTSVGKDAFYGCGGLKKTVFLGMPPSGLGSSCLLSCGTVVFPREYGAQWMEIRGINSFIGYGQGEKPEVAIVSAAIREDDPTVMDVVYKVASAKPTVKVRALAFRDGERSFAKVVRPTEFIEDTAKNIGDAIAANVEHRLSWRVSADWKVDLAKVKFEVLVLDGDLLPLELTTIPKIGDHAAMEISWNAITEQQVLDALLWLYADGDDGLVLTDGVLKRASDGYLLGYGATVSTLSGRNRKNVNETGLAYYYFAPAVGYVYSKMGFSMLSDEELKYANEITRLGLSPSGVRQYAWRMVEE